MIQILIHNKLMLHKLNHLGAAYFFVLKNAAHRLRFCVRIAHKINPVIHYYSVAWVHRQRHGCNAKSIFYQPL